MDGAEAAGSDPFADPSSDQDRSSRSTSSMLSLGRHVSLTLATDALIVIDEILPQRDLGHCCGLFGNCRHQVLLVTVDDLTDEKLCPDASNTTRAIPFLNVLWAELSEYDLVIRYAEPTSKQAVHPAAIAYPVDKVDRARAAAWVNLLLDRAYGESQRCKRIKVLVNPFGGKGSAPKWYLRDIEPIFAAARCEVDVDQTQHQGHAVEIAENMDIDLYDVVASCSGDGLPHEVFNGLGKRSDARKALAKIAVVQLPCGSGNAMSWNLNGTSSTSLAALCVVKGIRTPIDLTSITQGGRRSLSFLSQSVGIVAETDLGTDNLRWMGEARFTYGFLVRLLGKTVYPCDLAVEVEIADKPAIRAHYDEEVKRRNASQKKVSSDTQSIGDESMGLPPLQFGCATDQLPSGWELIPHDRLGNFYAGNMAYMAADTNFFPAALPNDGCLDLVCINGDISRLSSIRSLVAVGKGTFFDMEHVSYRKVRAYRIIPRSQEYGYISIDGERYPFEPFQAEVHKGLGTVLSKTGQLYEAAGVSPRPEK